MQNQSMQKILQDFCLQNKRIPEEKIRSTISLTQIKEIYSDWKSNDMGESFYLYTGTQSESSQKFYFLVWHLRTWNGGWSSEDDFFWHLITEENFNEFYEMSLGS